MKKEKLSRRRFITGVSTAALAGPLSQKLGAAEWVAPPVARPTTAITGSNSSITAETLAAAEQLSALPFSDAQRAPLLRNVADRAATFASMHAAPPLPNQVIPALTFDPRRAGVPAPTGRVERGGATWQPAAISRPATAEDLAFLSVAQLAALLKSRQVTSRELTELSLTRLKRFDPILSAVVTLTEERALRQADIADAELTAGKWRGPLHGIPWGAKDLLAVRGYPTTWGAAQFRNQQFEQDAEVVRRLDAAGAVLVAKLTLGALANGDTWFGGQTKCPWNLATGSSGSSAGPCAAVSAGLVPFAIGSETLGSIVSPCTRNAVTGLRPTFGRVSRTGAMSLAWSMDKLGPIARSVEDCALIFDAIHGGEPGDPASFDVPFAWQPSLDLRGQRIGYLASQLELKNEWFATNQSVLETLRRLGAEIVPLELPDVQLPVLRLILTVEAAAAFDQFTLSGDVDTLIAPQPSNWANLLREARYIPAVEYLQANRRRTLLVREFEEFLTKARVEVCISLPGGPQLTVTNLTGHPAVCVPVGFRPVEGQPSTSARRTAAAICFNARLYGDDRALSVAHAFQQASDWHLRRPPLA